MSLSSLFEAEHKTGPFEILTVCTGNICRSPLAETLLRKLLTGLPVRVQSAGTHALVDQPMTEQNRIITAELGVEDGNAHRARLLTPDLLRGTDLVLALTRDHRRAVAEMLPRASRMVFTLREFARLALAVDSRELQSVAGPQAESRMREAVDIVAQLRGSLPPLENPEDDDVVDPYRQSDEIYALSAQQIIPAVNAVAGLLRRSALGEA